MTPPAPLYTPVLLLGGTFPSQSDVGCHSPNPLFPEEQRVWPTQDALSSTAQTRMKVGSTSKSGGNHAVT